MAAVSYSGTVRRHGVLAAMIFVPATEDDSRVFEAMSAELVVGARAAGLIDDPITCRVVRDGRYWRLVLLD